jgi:drug/metabolite transporter (DMT)-like permease
LVTSETPSNIKSGTRQRTRSETLLLTCAVVLLNGFGNLALAYGMKHQEAVSANPLGYVRALFNPIVAVGVCMLVLWLLTRMTLMSWADLSFVVPITALGYVLSTILGRFFLNEQVGVRQWMGTLLIFAGAALVNTTQQRSGSSLDGRGS